MSPSKKVCLLILFNVCAVILLAAAGYYFINNSPKNDLTLDIKTRVPANESGEKTKPEPQNIYTTKEFTLPPNPFNKPLPRPKAPQQPERKYTGITLKGILYSEKTAPTAVIQLDNQKIVYKKEGDLIEEITIGKIHRNKIEIIRYNTTETIVLK